MTMGAYTYITKTDRVTMRKVFNPELNELFQEALKYCPSLMISEYPVRVRKGLFKTTIETRYSVYHEHPAHDGSPYQARHQFSASGNADTVVTYLHGIINGQHKPMCMSTLRYLINSFLNEEISISKFLEVVNRKSTFEPPKQQK